MVTRDIEVDGVPLKQGDIVTARGLFQDAIDSHPQHFEAAVVALNALQTTVVN